MNNTQDMLLYMQAQMLAKLQSTGGKKPTAPKSGDRERFQDLLSQKGQERTETPQAPTAKQPQSPSEKPELPTDTTQEGDVLDPYRLQLLAAAQAAAMAVPVLTAEPVPTPQPNQTQPIAAVQVGQTIQPPQAGTGQPVPEQQSTAIQAPVQAETPLSQTSEARAALPQQTVLPQSQGAQLTQPRQAETGEAVLQQAEQPVLAAPTAIRQAPETGGDTAQPELKKGSEPGKETVVTGAQTAPEQTLFRQVETTPVKVGDAPVLDTQAPDVEAQLAKQVDTLLSKGGDRVELLLNPASLGSVTVTLARSQDGSLQVSLSASGEKALAILEKHAAGLESALLNANRAPVQVEVQRNQDSQQSQNQQQTYDREGHGQQEQQQRQPQQDNSQDFLQQLRLGLFQTEGEAS